MTCDRCGHETAARSNAQRYCLDVPLRTVQQWSHRDSLSEPMGMLLVLLACRMVTFATIDEVTAGLGA